MQKRISVTDLAAVNIETVDKTGLVDISDMTFDNAVPYEQRAAQMIKTLKNPYCFLVGDIGVKLEFSDNAPNLQDIFANFLIRKKSGL